MIDLTKLDLTDLASPKGMAALCVGFAKMIAAFKASAEAPGECENMLASLCGDIDVLREQAAAGIRELLVEQGLVRPHFTLFGKHGVVIPILFDNMPETYFAKGLLATALASVVTISPVDSYFFASEMWVADYSDKTPRPGEEGYQMPRDRDDRREVVMVRLASPKAAYIDFFTIERSADGKPTGMTPITVAALFGIEGDSGEPQMSNPLFENLYTFEAHMKAKVEARRQASSAAY